MSRMSKTRTHTLTVHGSSGAALIRHIAAEYAKRAILAGLTHDVTQIVDAPWRRMGANLSPSAQGEFLKLNAQMRDELRLTLESLIPVDLVPPEPVVEWTPYTAPALKPRKAYMIGDIRFAATPARKARTFAVYFKWARVTDAAKAYADAVNAVMLAGW